MLKRVLTLVASLALALGVALPAAAADAPFPGSAPCGPNTDAIGRTVYEHASEIPASLRGIWTGQESSRTYVRHWAATGTTVTRTVVTTGSAGNGLPVRMTRVAVDNLSDSDGYVTVSATYEWWAPRANACSTWVHHTALDLAAARAAGFPA